MRIDIVSIFPEMFAAITDFGIPSRCVDSGKLELNIESPRQFAATDYGAVDDRPFGGGPGMVMQAEPLAKTVEKIQTAGNKGPVVYLSPQGRRFNQACAAELAEQDALVFICGRYEGIDERFIDHYVDEELSLGDYVLSGGELAAMVVIDAISRLLPDAVGNADSVVEDSFYAGLLDYPHYTRPSVWRDDAVPDVLLSGDHEKIRNWRAVKALERTVRRRPDLIESAALSIEQQTLLFELKKTLNLE